MTTFKTIAWWVLASLVFFVSSWEAVKAVFEIREALIRYYVIRNLPTEPIPINQSRS